MALKFAVLMDIRKGIYSIYILLLNLQYASNKAVSDGAVSYHIDHLVRARIAKYSCGVRTAIPYRESDPEHFIRRYLKYTGLDGTVRISDHFDVILRKVRRSGLHSLIL